MDPITPSKETAHERLLNAAAVLFYNDGIAATGIDAIVRKAGVAKKSLYNNFASKSDLVAQYLQVRHEEWLALYQSGKHPKSDGLPWQTWRQSTRQLLNVILNDQWYIEWMPLGG